MKKYFKVLPLALLALLVLQTGAVLAKPPRIGQLYCNGEVVRTLVPSGKPLQKPGTDPLYTFPTDGVTYLPLTNQYSITMYAPGDKEYRGGHWKVYSVVFNVPAYLIDTVEDLMIAQTTGYVSIEENPDGDVLCPVLPGKSMW